MAVIHSSLETELVAHLQPMLGNTFGQVAVWADSVESWDTRLSFGPEVDNVEAVGSPFEPSWDCLVCIGQLWKMPELPRLAQSLGHGRRLFFTEPVAAFGLASRAQRLAKPALRRRWGLDFSCDLPQDMRDAGITPTSVDRFRIGSALFTFAAGEARVF